MSVPDPLASVSTSVLRVEQIRDTLLTKMEGIVSKLDVDDGEAEDNAMLAETMTSLAETYINLRG